MIQKGTFLKVVDNSGAKSACCIRIVSNQKYRYASTGDIIIVSIKKLRVKRRFAAKVKKGALLHALVVRTKKIQRYFSGDSLAFFENSVILLKKKSKLVGTRIFGLLPRSLRFSQYMRLLALSAGIRS
jgi:large subunit ribosomal protein L14